jgi:hypothetical protein
MEKEINKLKNFLDRLDLVINSTFHASGFQNQTKEDIIRILKYSRLPDGKNLSTFDLPEIRIDGSMYMNLIFVYQTEPRFFQRLSLCSDLKTKNLIVTVITDENKPIIFSARFPISKTFHPREFNATMIGGGLFSSYVETYTESKEYYSESENYDTCFYQIRDWLIELREILNKQLQEKKQFRELFLNYGH